MMCYTSFCLYDVAHHSLKSQHLKKMNKEGKDVALGFRHCCLPVPQFFCCYYCIFLIICSILYNAQKMNFPVMDFFSKCDQIRSFLRIWSHLLKKSLMNRKLYFLCSDSYRYSWIWGFMYTLEYFRCCCL